MADIPEIPGYSIEKKLGEGGMAIVYLGVQKKLKRKVAIKVLDPSLLKNEIVLGRFLKEAETAAKFNHSNIISIFDVGIVENHFYIVTEFLEETLKERMYGYPPDFRLKPQEALDILKPLARALDYAHDRGIIHRDIKTENIMFRQDGTPVLVDFGVAQVLDSDSELTKTGISLGTPYYMSPEQCKAEELDGRTDFYSLGVVFYEVITGEKPYDAESPMGVALRHVQDPVPRLPVELRPYQVLIDKMMAKNKEERITNGKELAKLMDSVLSGLQSSAAVAAPTAAPAAAPPPAAQTPETQKIILPGDAAKTREFKSDELESVTLPFMEPAVAPEAEAKPPKPPARKQWKFPEFSKKLGIQIAALGILAVVIFIVFYNLGTGNQKETRPKSPATTSTKPAAHPAPTFSNEFLNQDRQYQIDYKHASEFYENGDLEKAMNLVNALKLKALTPEVKELGERIGNRIKESEEGRFETHLTTAREYLEKKDFKKAKEHVLLAKKIKVTAGLNALEEKINREYAKFRDRLKSSAERKKLGQEDARAFKAANAENTIAAYQKYLDEFPTGRHVDEAVTKLNRLREEEQLRKKAAKKAVIPQIKLRTAPKVLSFQDAADMLGRHNFFDNEFNKTGTFKNRYTKKFIGSDAVVTDQAAGLIWYGGSPPGEMTLDRAARWIRELNQQRFAGYGGWRLPTLEEAASLLRKNKNSAGLHIDAVFTGNLRSIWTRDRLRLQTYWVVRFYQGIVYADSDRTRQQVLPVRSAR